MNKKKNKFKKKAKPSVAPEQSRKRFPILHILAFVLFVVIIISSVLLIMLSIYTRFNKIEYLKAHGDNSIEFSYFVKRPDALASAKALIVYDATESVLLLSKNENVRFAPASTAKIMAFLIALEHYDLDEILEYSKILVDRDSSKMGLFLNEKVSVKNLLYGMMLPSGNDAAALLASNYPGGVNNFVARMNQKAKELGLLNTYFVDPAGYKDENYSTAYDLARMGAVALKNPFLSNVVSTKNIRVANDTGSITHNLKNLNELLDIPGVNGIKTGFTNEAEGVLVTSFLHNGNQYVIVVLRSQDRFKDTKDLISGITNDLKKERISY